MTGRRHRILMWPIRFIAIAGLQYPLISCSSGPLAPGDAVDSIRARPHNEAPTFVVVASPRGPTGRPATLTIDNHTECRINFSLKGPSSKQFMIDSGRSEIVNVAEGNYEFSVDTHLCAGDVRNLYGKSPFFNSGGTYELSLSQEDIRKGGDLIITNATDADLQIEVRNIRRTIGVDSKTTVQLPEGLSDVTLTGRCRNTPLRQIMRVEVEKDSVVRETFFCRIISGYTYK